MKVSIDGLIGSAQRLTNQQKIEEENLGKKREVKSDSVSLTVRINTRLDGIEKELRDIQSKLSNNQIVRDGLDQLTKDFAAGGANAQNIIKNVTYEGKRVLQTYVGEPVNDDTVAQKTEQIEKTITEDVRRLKGLEVELDNILASRIPGGERAEKYVENINSIFSERILEGMNAISNLRPDSVMRLIR